MAGFFFRMKSKIQNPKLVGLVAIGVAFALCGAVAQAQQTGKILRIGFLDNSTASGMAVLVDVFRQELSKLGWIEGKKHHHRTGFQSKSLSACLSEKRRVSKCRVKRGSRQRETNKEIIQGPYFTASLAR